MKLQLKNNGKGWYIRLIAGNNKILMISEIYYSKSSAKRTFSRLMKVMPDVKIANESV